MSYSNYDQGNVSEEYARKRVLDSPLRSINPSDKPLINPTFRPTQELSAKNHIFIQRMLCDVILFIQLGNKNASIGTLCAAIRNESSLIEMGGLAYIQEIKRIEHLEAQQESEEDPDGDLEEEEDEDYDEWPEEAEKSDGEDKEKQEEVRNANN